MKIVIRTLFFYTIYCILFSSVTFSQTNFLKNAQAQKLGADIVLEVTANVYTFMGAATYDGHDVVASADTSIVSVYYSDPQIGGGFVVNNILTDTINLGAISSSVKVIRVEMNTIQNGSSTLDTIYRPPSITLFLPLSVAGIGNDAVGVTIYPNPNKGSFTLDVPHASNTMTGFEILNNIGQLVYQKHLASGYGAMKKEIDMGDAPPGVYLLRLQTGKGVQTKRFTIQ